MADDLTQEQLSEWGYLAEQEMDMGISEAFQSHKPQEKIKKNEKQKSELEENEEKQKQIQTNLNKSDENLSQNAKEALNSLDEKEKIDEQIKQKQEEIIEFNGTKEKSEYLKNGLDKIEKDEFLKESLDILKEKEKIDEQIKEKEQTIKEDQDKKEKEINNKTEMNKENTQNKQETEAEQIDWSKKADELELQHQKELEELKDKQSKLEANFNNAIDNLMNTNGVNGIISALQELDRSLEILQKQGKEESEVRSRQRQEKLELAFDSPKFKEAVGDLVKEVYSERKKVKSGIDDIEKERSNYAKLRTTYEKEKNKGLDIKGYYKIKDMMETIDKETPNFKNAYPKMYKEVNQTLEKTKEKILDKTKNKENDRSREL